MLFVSNRIHVLTNTVFLLQATFLRGASVLSNRKAENPVLAAELEQLQDDQLDTRCRRNGLSKKGGRDMQVCPPLHVEKKRRGEKRKKRRKNVKLQKMNII